MMYTADYFIEKLDMIAHPEGGFYKESFKSETAYSQNNDSRALWTSIYFLLRTGEISHLHRLKSDEMWYYHAGEALSIYMISPEGELTIEQLGLNITNGEKPQVLVPKGYIFGSAMNQNGFSLVGCMVSPGFDFKDFELFNKEELIKQYPTHIDIIEKLAMD